MFTEADFNGWRFKRDAMHINGGREFFGHGHHCVDQPRLMVIDKYFRKDRSTQRSYMIDGETVCATLDAALAALATPPALTDEDRKALSEAPDDWTRPEARLPYISLGYKGFVEWGRDADDRVTMRRTEAGRNALASHIQ